MALASLLGTMADAAPAPAGLIWEYDFDRDGVRERVVARPGTNEIQRWVAAAGAWEKADYELPGDVAMLDAGGGDAGLRFLDLNGDGFDDVLFANAERFAVHLWTKDVQPHLGWTRGWSQFVRAGPRTGAAHEPPSLVGAEVQVEAGELIVVRPAGPGRVASTVRRRLRELIAFDVPPPKSPEEALGTMQVRPGFRVELVAAEPVVIDPIAFDWDAEGRMWVVEMRDYPLGLDGRGEPGGVVKVLEDADGDGRFEGAAIFLDGISFPSSVMPWGQGALIAAAPDIFYAEDTDGDGRADRRQVLFTGFTPGNQQHRVNGFEWGLDGWVYAANGDSGGEVKSLATGKTVAIRGRDIRFKPDTGEIETVSVQTQYGRRRDDWGNWFGNNNPTWLWHVTVPEHYLRRNPRVAAARTMRVLANYEDSTRVFPASAAMVRPNQPWSLNHVTSACSPSPYRDDLFGAEFATSVFICEPVHNVIHREVLAREGATFSSRRAEDEQRSEFLASTDNWFRPTTVKTGPDGALYIADMYRFVLEHPEWISPEMQARLDLRAGTDKGRIFRVVPADRARRGIPNLAAAGIGGWVAGLTSPNGWQRDMAQRLLVGAGKRVPIGQVEALLSLAHAPQVRMQALATLGLLGALRAEALTAALRDPHPGVRCEALRQAEVLAGRMEGATVFGAVAALAADSDGGVRVQAAFSLGAWPPEASEPVLQEMIAASGANELLRLAAMTSLRAESGLFAALDRKTPIPKSAVASTTLKPTSPDRAAIVASYAGVETLRGDAERGRMQFANLCAPCHRLRGDGFEVGPDLAMVGTKPVDWLLLAILDPDQAVEARYQAWTVTLKSGDELDGLIAAETANNLVIRLAGGAEHPVLRSDIAGLEPRATSLMPGGFEAALKREDMADLLAWLRGP